MKIGLIGLGVVGSTLQYGFRRLGHEVIPYDIKDRNTALMQVLPTELTFICVPTASAPDGSCDVSVVESVVAELAAASYRGLAVVKSTVVPGTMDRLHMNHKLALAFCPEFLREKCTHSDFVDNHDVCIIGAYRYCDYKLIEMAHGYYPKKFVRLTPMEAEFCKYFSNVFNALRINFANQFYDVCRAAGVDYMTIKQAISQRQNIGGHYLDCAPEFRGFGGSCLPKDTLAFARYVEQLGVDAPMFRRIVEDNGRSAK